MDIFINFIPSIIAIFCFAFDYLIISTKRSSDIGRLYDSMDSILLEKFKKFISEITNHYSNEVLRLMVNINPNNITLQKMKIDSFNFDYLDFLRFYEKVQREKKTLDNASYRIMVYRILFAISILLFIFLCFNNYIIKIIIPDFINIIMITLFLFLLIYYLFDIAYIYNKIDVIRKEYGLKK